MKKQDPYCYPETSVLKNKFNIREVSLLEKAEADLSRAKMSILYESPVDKFDAQSFLRVHEFLFEEVYDWAGRLRTINISKPEEVLGGKSIWYEDALDLPESLDRACTSIVDCALPGFVDSKNEEKTERNAGYLVVSHSGGGMLRQGTRKGIRRTPANRGMRAHWVVKGLDISEDVCHGMCP